MPLPEPVSMKAVSTADLLVLRDQLWATRLNGRSATRYSDGSYVSFKTDAEQAAALGAIDSELARRQSTAVTTILVSSSKGLES